jgi:hypothetical protein
MQQCITAAPLLTDAAIKWAIFLIAVVGGRSGSQLTSGFGGANIGVASAQLGEEEWKNHDKAYLRIIDTLHT